MTCGKRDDGLAMRIGQRASANEHCICPTLGERCKCSLDLWAASRVGNKKLAAAGQSGCHRRKQAPWSGACLHRREAEGAGHVAVGQGTAATWPAQSHVQGRIARARPPSTPKPGKAATLHPKTVTFVTGAKSDFSKLRRQRKRGDHRT